MAEWVNQIWSQRLVFMGPRENCLKKFTLSTCGKDFWGNRSLLINLEKDTLCGAWWSHHHLLIIQRYYWLALPLEGTEFATPIQLAYSQMGLHRICRFSRFAYCSSMNYSSCTIRKKRMFWSEVRDHFDGKNCSTITREWNCNWFGDMAFKNAVSQYLFLVWIARSTFHSSTEWLF
jgi:hypothetical protein